MSMTKYNNIKNDCIILNTLEELVPQEHLVRKLEATIDWRFIYPMVEKLYSKIGRPSIDPVVLFKMIFINYLFGINSMRRTCEEIKVNIAYRWFLGISMNDKVPNYSTWSQNYIRRYSDSEVFDLIFERILKQAIIYGFVDTESVFGDSTHQKASANKRKSVDKEVAIIKKYYEEDLKEEINKDRIAHGKKPLKEIEEVEINYDEETGEEIKTTKTKHIKESITDPESGLYHKGEKERCFAYSHQTICDTNGFVLVSETVAGNVHDSVSFKQAFDKLKNKFQKIKNVGLDAGYKTPAIAKDIIESGMIPQMPYKRAMTKKGYFKKYEYVYDEEYNCVICPKGEILKYFTTNKNGYREFKSNPNKCKNCSCIDKCTKSKNHTKVVLIHVWDKYIEEVEEIRHTLGSKDIYDKRKETIERVFADCKESHGLRYTRLRGLKKNQNQALIIFACHNLKRMAKWSWYFTQKTPISFIFCDYITNLFDLTLKKVILSFESTTLSTN